MKLGFIGLGIMGEAMACNLVTKGDLQVIVYDIDASKVQTLVAKGAIAASSANEVVEQSDIFFTMVPKSEHVKAVYNSIKDSIKKDQIWIDMSTIDPSTSAKIAQKVKSQNAFFLDAPVVKSQAAAINGTLGIYVGGEYKKFKVVEPLLELMGSNVIYMGENSKGLYMKIAHNMLVGQIQNGVNEMFAFVSKVGLDLEDVPKAISYGGGQNFYLDGKANNIINGEFPTAFSIENMAKDVKIANSIMDELDLDLKGFTLINDIYNEALNLGLAKEDFSATYKVVKKVGNKA